MTRIATVIFCFALAGCMSGKVLIGQSQHAANASLVSASPLTVIRIAPIHHPSQATEIPRGEPTQLWLTAGWYMVTYACDVQYDKHGKAVGVMVREYNTERRFHAEPGRAYRFACAPHAMGVLDIVDVGIAPNNSIQRTPTRSAGRRR